MNLLYLIGEPGSGKSTLTAALVQGRRRRVHKEPFAHTLYEGGLVQLGRERGGGFSGTDALSMSVQPKVVAVLEARAWPNVLGEGDRLANGRFFTAAREAGYEVDVALLQVDEELAAARRAERGSNQDPTWLAGRRTKVNNLQPYVTITLDASRSVAALVDELSGHRVFNGNGA